MCVFWGRGRFSQGDEGRPGPVGPVGPQVRARRFGWGEVGDAIGCQQHAGKSQRSACGRGPFWQQMIQSWMDGRMDSHQADQSKPGQALRRAARPCRSRPPPSSCRPPGPAGCTRSAGLTRPAGLRRRRSAGAAVAADPVRQRGRVAHAGPLHVPPSHHRPGPVGHGRAGGTRPPHHHHPAPTPAPALSPLFGKFCQIYSARAGRVQNGRGREEKGGRRREEKGGRRREEKGGRRASNEAVAEGGGRGVKQDGRRLQRFP